MEHLVESHMGGFYVSNESEDVIEAYCEQCGDYDRIILSWAEGMKKEAFEKYFSMIKMTEENIKEDYENGITKDEIIEGLTYYYDNDRELVKYLLKNMIISEEEKDTLLKKISIAQNRQFGLLKYVFNEVIKENKLVKLKK